MRFFDQCGNISEKYRSRYDLNLYRENVYFEVATRYISEAYCVSREKFYAAQGVRGVAIWATKERDGPKDTEGGKETRWRVGVMDGR